MVAISPTVLVNGPVSWDALIDLEVLPRPEPHMVLARGHRQGLGGTSAGKALGLARLGIRTTLRTIIGTDDDAARILAALDHPLLTVLAHQTPGPSEHHLNLMSADGGRVSIYLDLPGPPPAPDAEVLAALSTADIAVIDLAESSLPVLAAARDAGCQIWCDIHDYDGVADFHRPFIEAADVLMVSADRLPAPRRFLADAVNSGTSLAVCTDGARGATALSATEGACDVGAFAAPNVFDTNGAGDAFCVGLLAARAAGRPLAVSLRWAAAAGSLAVQSRDLAPPNLSRAAVLAIAEGS